MRTNGIFIIYALIIVPECLKIEKYENDEIWHYRYDHLSWKGEILVKKEMVKGLPELQEIEGKFKDFLLGKQYREANPKKSQWRASEKLELIHFDICGPIKPSSNAGSRYFLTFADNFSRKTWTYILKEKSQAFELFNVFKSLV